MGGGGFIALVYSKTLYPRLQKAAGLMAMHMSLDATKKLYAFSLKKIDALAQAEDDNRTRNGILTARDELRSLEAQLKREEDAFYKQTGLPKPHA
jgi:hypothetical protein